MNGKGVIHYENGRTLYEGEWKDGERNGKGISYKENGEKDYEGEWKNGKPKMMGSITSKLFT